MKSGYYIGKWETTYHDDAAVYSGNEECYLVEFKPNGNIELYPLGSIDNIATDRVGKLKLRPFKREE